jgi:hypothetical protein
MQLQKRIKQLCVPLLAAVILSACNSDNNDTAVPPSPPPVEKTAVKIIHAVSDAPNVKIDGGPAIQVNGLPFAQSTAKYSIPAGATTVAVDALLPGNATARVIGPATLNLLPTQTYAVFAVGLAANSSIEALVVSTCDCSDFRQCQGTDCPRCRECADG